MYKMEDWIFLHSSRFPSKRYILSLEIKRYTEKQVRAIAFETWRYGKTCEYVFHNLQSDLSRYACTHLSQKLIIARMLPRAVRSNGSKINRGVKGISWRVNERVFFTVSRVVKRSLLSTFERALSPAPAVKHNYFDPTVYPAPIASRIAYARPTAQMTKKKGERYAAIFRTAKTSITVRRHSIVRLFRSG